MIAVTDEVYEHLIFEGEHLPLVSFPGMRDRTVTISSAGKTFSLTGWKIGWVCASEGLVSAVRTVKQFLTYTSGTPFQHAVAEGLELAGPVLHWALRRPFGPGGTSYATGWSRWDSRSCARPAPTSRRLTSARSVTRTASSSATS